MSILSDIEKVRQIPQADESSTFVLQRESKMFRQNRRINKHKPPRNVNLYDNEDSNVEDCLPQNNYLPESEIESSIREANGGISYSNESLEKHWRARQIENSLNSSVTSIENDLLSFQTKDCKNSTTKISNTKILSENQNRNTVKDDEENILRKCKLEKNAAIRGLIKCQKISLKDLQVPNDSININDKNNILEQNQNVAPNNLDEEICGMKLVQLPEDPDVFVQPLQAYGHIDESKYKNIDFTVPRIGKKKSVTPRQFFIKMDDTSFGFVKNEARKKKK